MRRLSFKAWFSAARRRPGAGFWLPFVAMMLLLTAACRPSDRAPENAPTAAALATTVVTPLPTLPPPSPTPAGFVLYDEPARGLSFRYPVDWQVEESRGNLVIGSQPGILTAPLPDDGYGVMVISLTSQAEAGIAPDADATAVVNYLAEYVDQFMNEGDELRQPAAAATIANRSGASATVVTQNRDGHPITVFFHLIRSSRRLALVIAFTASADEADFEPIISHISHSITVTNPDLAFVAGVTQAPAGLSRAHDNDFVYPAAPVPPVGGVHHSAWQNCGVYTDPVDPRHVLHSLEHGAVWITYQAELATTAVQQLQDRVQSEPLVILSPYPGLRSPIVLTAWGLQLEVNSVDDPRIDEFITHYQNGPQTPEPGATCQGGVGMP
jgi:hypothetical protein